MVNILGQIEQSLVERLKGQLPTPFIDAYPNDPAGFAFVGGAHILIRYEGANYSDPREPDDYDQIRTTTWALTLLTRSLRDHRDSDIYSLIEGVRLSLQGWCAPQGAYGTTITKEGFVTVNDAGIWRYDMTISIATLSIIKET